MTEIIKITEQNGKRAVSARELYEKLGFHLSQWSRWSIKNVACNEFAVRGEDWTPFDIGSNADNQLFNPNPSIDYALSIDFAKKLCMLARTAKGEEIRNYFIECEKQLNKPRELSRKELALMIIQAEEAKELAEARVKELTPKAEVYDKVMSAEGCIDIGEAAKVLKLPYGRNNLFKRLRELGILMRDNVPYQQYVSRGYFKCIESHFATQDKSIIHIQTVVTQKGLEWMTGIIL